MFTNFTIDCVIFGFHEGVLKVLLTERNQYPFKDWWALPGFFVNHDEEMWTAVQRILYEHTGLKNIYMEQLAAFAGLKRHPQGRVLTVAHFALMRLDALNTKVRPKTAYMKQAKWFSIHKLPDLAFDHQQIIDLSLEKLKRKIGYSPIAFELLPQKFTLSQLQQVYEVILGLTLDKRNFRKKMLKYGFLQELTEFQIGLSHRSPRLYQLDKDKFKTIFSPEG